MIIIRKIILLFFVIISLIALSACSQDDILHLGVNARIVDIDIDNQILYISDYGDDKIFGSEFAIDCSELIQDENIIYVNYDTHNLFDISFDDLRIGDDIIISLYQSQLDSIPNGIIQVEQIQLATQRLFIN